MWPSRLRNSRRSWARWVDEVFPAARAKMWVHVTATEILDRFPNKTALVIGDICLDRWCTYDPAFTEPSRETGIPRLAVVSSQCTPGAGGTVAGNLAALGVGRVAVLGAIGLDGFGHELMQALRVRGISVDLLITSETVTTFTYTKLLNRQTQLEDQPRLDFINPVPLPEDVENRILGHLRAYASAFDLILVSDQAETACGGVVTPAVRLTLQAMAELNPQKVVWTDSRVRSELFRRVVLKGNRQEADDACRNLFGKTDYSLLRSAVQAPFLFVTLGPDGVLVVDAEGETLVPTKQQDNPVDICGAGDSFSAGAAMALSISGSALDAARFGNLVASITITKKGTGTASPNEIRAAAALHP